MPDELTVANSSCLIALDAVGYLSVLRQLYEAIDVPDAVNRECAGQLPAWVQVRSLTNRSLAHSLMSELGAGEAEAIALCVERSANRIILDDKKARRIARELKLPLTGTLAILLRAKEAGILANVRDPINRLLTSNFRVSDALIAEILRRAGELAGD
jgi:predicted nucleic acid-binding protein